MVTGAPGSGKTEFSKRTTKLLGYEYVNAGQLLKEELSALGIDVHSREEIGRLFFQHRSIDDYLSILKARASTGMVIDGIRLAIGVETLRKSLVNSIHIHRLESAQSSDDAYSDQEALLAMIADHKVTWKESVDALDPLIQDLFG